MEVIKKCSFFLFLLLSSTYALVPELHYLHRTLQSLEGLLKQQKPVQPFTIDQQILKEHEQQVDQIETIYSILNKFTNLGGPELVNNLLKNIQNTLNKLPQASKEIQNTYKKEIYTIITELAYTLQLANMHLNAQQQTFLKKIQTAAKPPQTPIPVQWLTVPADRMIGPITAPVIKTSPPYVLQSGNQILQLEVLSQFLTLGAFTEKNFSLASGIMAFLLPMAQQTEKNLKPFIQKYIKRLTKYSTSNKNLQQGITPLWKGNDQLIGGGGASCGYQAIKNAISILQATQMNIEYLANIIDVTYANQLFGLAETNELILSKKEPGTWRTSIVNNFRKKNIIQKYLTETLKLEKYFLTQYEVPDENTYISIKRSIENIYQNILDQFLKQHESTLIIDITNQSLITAINHYNSDLTPEIVQQYMIPGITIEIHQQIPIAPLFSDYAIKFLKGNSEEFLKGEWLHEGEIRFILEKIKKTASDLQFIGFSVFETPIKILEEEVKAHQEISPDVALANQSTIDSRKHMIQTTFNKTKQNYFHAFILGGMSQASPQGHWVTLVINIVQGKVQYLILDSSNAPRYQSHLSYTNSPQYTDKNVMGPKEIIADHIHEIIELVEQARSLDA